MSSGDKRFMVISREGGDFSMDLIYAGLVRRFGFDRVIDYPPRDKFRRAPNLVGDDERDYGQERMSLGYVRGCEDNPRTDRKTVGDMLTSGEISHVFMDETDESFFELLNVVKFLAFVPARIVIIAGHDRFRGDPTSVQMRFGRNFEAMFIDDWQPAYDSLPRTHLINLSTNFDHLWMVEDRDRLLADKRFDICFVGYNSHPARKIVIDHLRSRWGHLNNHLMLEERPDEFSQFVRHERMFRDMAQSRICLNLPGASAGRRALRFYEIPYVGSYMLSCSFPAKLLHPFEDGVHCDYFINLDDLDERIDAAIADEGRITSLAAAGRYHAEFNHTVDARMNYVLGVIGC